MPLNDNSCKKLIRANKNLINYSYFFMKFEKIFLIIYFVLVNNNAYAYIDPGTGGILLQALLGIVAAIGAYITLFWRKFKNFVNRIFKIKKKDWIN